MTLQDKPIFAISRTDPNYEPADAFGEPLTWWRVTPGGFAKSEQGWHMIVATAPSLDFGAGFVGLLRLRFALHAQRKPEFESAQADGESERQPRGSAPYPLGESPGGHGHPLHRRGETL